MLKFIPQTLALALLAGAVSSHADQVITEPLVVQQSMSIGNDSQAGWSYGADTLVFRENNLRIYFDDTSDPTSTYPYNDWRILVNDTETNSTSFFAIQDATANRTPFKIMAGAQDNALYINSDSVGINTTDPKLDLHMKSSDTPALRLEQSNAGGYAAHTWDVGGNEANFFVRDLTAGSLLPFRIRPGAPTSTLDLKGDGAIGMCLTNGNHGLKARVVMNVNTNLQQGVLIGSQNVATNLATLHVEGTGYVTDKLGVGTGAAAQSSTLHVNGTAFISQTLEIGSSRTRKENIREVTLEEAQAALKHLQPVQFNYKGDREQQLGFIAEDVPDAVATQSRKSVVPMDFVAVLTKVVQDHERRETELEQTIESQQQLLNTLAERLSAMEERMKASQTRAQ